MNIPNLLTLSRVFLIPVFFFLYFNQYDFIAFSVLVFSLLTDYFDGYFARKLNQSSPLGALLDPIADKTLVLSYYGYLYFDDRGPWWLIIAIYLRNISQLLAIPILSWWLKREFKVKPKWPAKWATGLAFGILPLFYFPELINGVLSWGRFWFLTIVPLSLICLALEVYIFVTYVPRLVQIAVGKHDTFE